MRELKIVKRYQTDEHDDMRTTYRRLALVRATAGSGASARSRNHAPAAILVSPRVQRCGPDAPGHRCSSGRAHWRARRRSRLRSLAGHPQTIGELNVDTCEEAIAILDKSDIVTGKKTTSDPAYNLAAQLLAATLNITAGAGFCAEATNTIALAQALLDAINFTGAGAYKASMMPTQITNANNYAGILDSYNNNTLCPCRFRAGNTQ